jgi:hypothetical protein
MRQEVFQLICCCHVGQALIPNATIQRTQPRKSQNRVLLPKAADASCHRQTASQSLSGIGKNRYQ